LTVTGPGGSDETTLGPQILVTDPPVVHSLPFADNMNMDNGYQNWHPTGMWWLTAPVATANHDPGFAWQGLQRNTMLTLVDQLDLTNAISPTITFWQQFTFDEGTGQVIVSSDNGLTWQPVLTATAPITDWVQSTIDLSAYSGQIINLAFYLTEAGIPGDNPGWYIDDVVVEDIASSSTPTPTPTDTPTSTPTDTSTPTLTPSNTPSSTPTQTPSSTPTWTFTPTRTPTNTPTPTYTFTPTPTPNSTGFKNPAANSADSGGDGDGYEVKPAEAYSDNALFASDNNSGTGAGSGLGCSNTGADKHRFYDYNFSIPGTVNTVITGIEVRLDAKADSIVGSPKICVQLSWDGGLTWTTSQITPTLVGTETTYLLGGVNDTWGHNWQLSEFSNANFRVRIVNTASSTDRDFFLDWIAVKVYYE